MKTVTGLYAALCDPEHLTHAAALTARGKRRRADVAWFLFRQHAELRRIRAEPIPRWPRHRQAAPRGRFGGLVRGLGGSQRGRAYGRLPAPSTLSAAGACGALRARLRSPSARAVWARRQRIVNPARTGR